MADTAQIEEIVKQVLASMSGMGSASGGENRTAPYRRRHMWQCSLVWNTLT